MKKLIGGVLLSVVFAAGAEAATYYTATTGSDTNPGTLSAPFRTITKAASVARAGDAVQVRGGVYNEIVKISSKGTSTARIVFQPYAGEVAVIDGTGSAAGTNLVQLSSAAFVDFVGFEVRNATRIGICGWGVNNVRILRNKVHRSQKSGIYLGYSSIGATYDNLVDGNTVYSNVLENQYHTMNGGWSQAVSLHRTVRSRVTNNTVHSNDGEGIVFVLSDHGYASKNTVYDNFSVNIYLDNARYTTIESNMTGSSGNTRYYRDSHPAHGIGMANEAYSTSNPLTDNIIRNNVIVRTRWGIYYGNYENGGGLKNTLIANNTVLDASAAMLNIDLSAHAGTIVENNIFSQTGTGAMARVAGGGITYRTNNWHGGSAGTAAGAGDVVGDPRLVRPYGGSANDYKLMADSPLLRKGTASSRVPSDYFGVARANNDIGMHQLSN